MKVLLDTHAFLWFISGDPKLSPTARSTIENLEHDILLSPASAWEMAINISLGKLSVAEPFDVLVPRELARNHIDLLPIKLTHVGRVSSLPFHHRDPFDRLLIAQALTENIAIASADAMFDAYGTNRLW